MACGLFEHCKTTILREYALQERQLTRIRCASEHESLVFAVAQDLQCLPWFFEGRAMASISPRTQGAEAAEQASPRTESLAKTDTVLLFLFGNLTRDVAPLDEYEKENTYEKTAG